MHYKNSTIVLTFAVLGFFYTLCTYLVDKHSTDIVVFALIGIVFFNTYFVLYCLLYVCSIHFAKFLNFSAIVCFDFLAFLISWLQSRSRLLAHTRNLPVDVFLVLRCSNLLWRHILLTQIAHLAGIGSAPKVRAIRSIHRKQHLQWAHTHALYKVCSVFLQKMHFRCMNKRC